MLARLLLRTRSVNVRLRLPPLRRTALRTLRDPITSPRRRIPAPALSSCLRSDTSRVGMPARPLLAFSSRCPSIITRTTRPHHRTARKIRRCTILVSLHQKPRNLGMRLLTCLLRQWWPACKSLGGRI